MYSFRRLIGLFSLLSLLYLLSAGPASYFLVTGALDADLVHHFYYPIVSFSRSVPALDAYIDWWIALAGS